MCSEKRRNLCSSSKENCWWCYRIPEDLIREILVRLPVKSLLRFKSVCKSWNSIITNPSFAITQFSHSLRQHLLSSHLIVQRNNDESVFVRKNDFNMFALHLDLTDVHHKHVMCKSVPISYDLKQFYVAGSCNGLICMFDGWYGMGGRNMYVWNPTINKTRIIPLTTIVSVSYGWLLFLFGFGYASSIDDYKIVLVVHYTLQQHYTKTKKLVHVYSFRHDAWSVTDLEEGYHSILLRNHLDSRMSVMVGETVVVDDALYWTIEQPNFRDIILRFDMVSESFDRVVVFEKTQQINTSDAGEEKYIYIEQSKVGVGWNNDNLCVWHVYNETYCCSHLWLPNLVEMRAIRYDDNDQHMMSQSQSQSQSQSHSSWETRFRIQAKNSRHRLLTLIGNGRVIIFATKKNKYDHRNDYELQNLLIYDARTFQSQRNEEGLLVEVRTQEYCTPHIHQILNYVPSLISPHSLFLCHEVSHSHSSLIEEN